MYKEEAMDRYLTASQARHEFLALVDAAQQGERVIVTKRGVPAAAVVGFEELETLRALARLCKIRLLWQLCVVPLTRLSKGR